VLRRRIELGVYDRTVRIDDVVENQGFRPTPHAILYHVNFGYPFLDEAIELGGDLDESFVAAFNAEDKRPMDDFADYYEDVPTASKDDAATIMIMNRGLSGGLCVKLNYSRVSLPLFGVWRAFQSGVYALALEPARPTDPAGPSEIARFLLPNETATYRVSVEIGECDGSGPSASTGRVLAGACAT
ncbi:DUF4432 family protein, partial [Notoacmeibacter sp. MSK16QG-6]|uniref:DUF4432 family protein n=1 Tax=Notoacmeibacter sp. MSK16QG-6 TaxID=2957982 RepID=UPI0020A06721